MNEQKGRGALPGAKVASFILLLFSLRLLAACGTAQSVVKPLSATRVVPSALPDQLFVDPAQTLGSISPYVYGTNYGPWVFLLPAVKPLAIDAHLKFLRFPAGEYGDSVDLEHYQLDDAVTLARDLGAELSSSVRLMNGTPEAAANLVKYTNQAKGYAIKYWSIGNEPNLYATRSDGIPGYDTKRFNQEWRSIAQAMRAIDPSIKLIGPEINQFQADRFQNPKDVNGFDWLEEFLKANGDLVDVVAVHRYPFGDPAPTIDQLLANSSEWDRSIPVLRETIENFTEQDKQIAITEINSDWATLSAGEATPETFYNALWWGDVLGRLISQRVDIVAQFLLTSKSGAGGGEMGLLSSDAPRPSYYVYQMYQRFGGTLVAASTDDPNLSIFASRPDDHTLTLMLINRTNKSITKPLQLIDFKPSGAAQVWLFDQAHNATQIESQTLSDGSSITLLPYSMTLFVLNGS